VGLTLSRFRLLLVTAVPTEAVTPLIVGPLSFVGLMAPHRARMMGLQRPMPQLYGAAVIGALTMLPRRLARSQPALPLPAGLLATFIGGPYFMKLMAKGGR
jgi:ABC-type Fe3+-siderophore transport system permease subunit